MRNSGNLDTREYAKVEDILAAVDRTLVDDATITDRLNVLFDMFNRTVRAIDPSITGAWVGRDEGDGDFKRPFSIFFERNDNPFLRRSS